MTMLMTMLMNRLPPVLTSLRARLIGLYLLILLVGFAALAGVAGGQIAAAARADYAVRLEDTVRLIAQGMRQAVLNSGGDIESAAVQDLIARYETQTGGTLHLLRNGPPPRTGGQAGGQAGQPGDGYADAPEVESAHGDVVQVVERADDAGQPTFYTAALITPVTRGGRGGAGYGGAGNGPGNAPEAGNPNTGNPNTGNPNTGNPNTGNPNTGDPNTGGYVVQLAIPTAALGQVVTSRFAQLGAVLAGVLLAATVAALLVARSILRPLSALREGAVRLSRGELAYRVPAVGADEIGDVGRAFNRMAEQVQGMVEEQRAFASNTAHELRTPLTTIRLRSEALRYEETLEPETARQYIAEIDSEAERMGGLIDDLTLLSRFDAGRAERGHDQIDLYAFAHSLHQRFKPQLDAKGVRLQLDLPPELPPISTSLNHLTIVFRNLLDNAIKYTPTGSKTSSQIVWQMAAQTGGVRHTITDSGQGVAAEQLPHLFERFYRGDRAHTREIPGSGLGLAIVKSAVEFYGGSVQVRSAGKDTGTTVEVFWPTLPIGDADVGGTAGSAVGDRA